VVVGGTLKHVHFNSLHHRRFYVWMLEWFNFFTSHVTLSAFMNTAICIVNIPNTSCTQNMTLGGIINITHRPLLSTDWESRDKANPVTGRRGPQRCETSRIPHFLDNRLTDGGEAIKPYEPAALYIHEESWYSFLLESESTLGPQCGWKD
jgi:hypothetical protein